MKKLLSGLLIGSMALASLGFAGCKDQTRNASVQALQNAPAAQAEETLPIATGVERDYPSPLMTFRADPYLCKSASGKYYFTGSYPKYDRIELLCADTVAGISGAVPIEITKDIWQHSEVRHVWAPELHYVMGQWVMYYAQAYAGNDWGISCHALKLVDKNDETQPGQDPMTDKWVKAGKIEHIASDTVSFQTGMSLDMTVFENKGRWYAIWAQKPNSSNLYLAELETPFKLKSAPIVLTTPEYLWEIDREKVNEGPAVLKVNGKIFVSFSASATGHEYCMGLLEMDEDDDPLNINNWTKHNSPVFSTDPDRYIYGPGHNSFVQGDDGEWLCILHFRDYRYIQTDKTPDLDSLYDYNRQAHVMKLKFDENGTPIFDFGNRDLYNVPFLNNNRKTHTDPGFADEDKPQTPKK